MNSNSQSTEENGKQETDKQETVISDERLMKLVQFEVAEKAKADVVSWAQWIVGSISLVVFILGGATYWEIHCAIKSATDDQIKEAKDRIQESLNEFEAQSKQSISAFERRVEEVRSKADDAEQRIAIAISSRPLLAPVLKSGENVIVGPGTSIAIKSESGAFAATVCCVVEDASKNRYFLTINNSPSFLSQEVFDSAGRKIGEGAKYSPIALLVRIAKGVKVSVAPPGLKRFEGVETGILRPHEDVVGFGFASGRVEGKTRETMSVSTVYEAGTEVLVWTSTSLSFEDGDGGGPVINSKNQLVGMIYSYSPEKSKVAPIGHVLKELGVSLVTTL